MIRLPLLVLSLMMFLSLTACNGSLPTDANREDSWIADSYRELSYSVRNSWTKDTYETTHSARYAQSFKENGSPEGISLDVSRADFYENQEKITDVSVLAEKIAGGYLSSAGNPSLTYYEPFIVNEFPAYEIWITAEYSPDYKVEIRTILVEKPDGIYRVDLSAPSDYAGDFASDYQKIKNSLN